VVTEKRGKKYLKYLSAYCFSKKKNKKVMYNSLQILWAQLFCQLFVCDFVRFSVERPYPPGNCSIIVINLICQLVGESLSGACFKTILWPLYEWIESQSFPLVRALPLQLFRHFPIKPPTTNIPTSHPPANKQY